MPPPKEINPEDYIKHLINGENDPKKARMMVEKAYQTALDTRKFEIELYWKRATYFWAFIAAIFIAVFSILNGRDFTLDAKLAYIDILRRGLVILLSLLGYSFSLGWFFVNRGSKVWQKNWETHIDLLEDKITGPLFKTIIKPNLEFRKLNLDFAYSVSKVNQTLSLFVIVFWLILILTLTNILLLQYVTYLILNITLLLLIIFISIILHYQSISFMYKDWKENRNRERTFYIKMD